MPTLPRRAQGPGGLPLPPFARVLSPLGGTNDDVQFQATINNLGSAGGTIVFRGIPKFSTTVTIDRDDLTIMGESMHFAIYQGHGWNGSTNVMANGLGGSCIEVQSDISAFTITENSPDSDGRHRNLNFVNFGIRGPSQIPASYVGSGITGGGNDDRCHFIGLCMYHLKKCLSIWCDTAFIQDCNFQDNLNDCITYKGLTLELTNCLIWDNGGRCLVTDSAGVWGILAVGNHLAAPSTNCVYLDTATNAAFTNNYFGPATGTQVATVGGSGHSFTGNQFIAANGNTTSGLTIGTAASPTTGVKVVGNTFDQQTSVVGYAVDSAIGSTGCSFSANTISGGGWNSASTTQVWRLPAGAFIGPDNAGLGSVDQVDPRIILGINCVGMYDPTDKRSMFTDLAATTAVAANNDKVAIWKDQSQYGYTLSALNASSPDWRPTWKSADVNSVPYILFNGAHFMQNTDGGTWAGHPGVIWGSFGIKLTGGTGTVLLAYPFNSAWGSPFADWMVYENSGTSLNFRIGATTNNITTFSDISATSSVVSFGNGTGISAQNNVPQAATASTARVTYTNNTGISIGAHNASGTLGEQVTGYYGAIVLANAEPSSAQQTSINKWIAAKGGIATSGF